MNKKRNPRVHLPIRRALVTRMKAVTSSVRHATIRAVEVARLIGDLEIAPEDADVIDQAFEMMLLRLGGIEHRRFTRRDRSILYHARDSINEAQSKHKSLRGNDRIETWVAENEEDIR